jgi:hypothetical protein
VAALVASGACSSGDYRSGPPPPPTTTTTAPEVTLRVVVGVFSSSARVITLAQAVSGFTSVVVPTEAEIVRASGVKAGVGDITARALVEVTGRPSSVPDALVARRLVLL